MGHPYPASPFASPAAPPSAVAVATILLVLAIDIALIRYCLSDLDRRAIVVGGNKTFWAAAIVLGGPLGQMAYMLYGRGEF